MTKTVIETELFCDYCNHETEHEIEYISDKIQSITCKNCGSTVHLDLPCLEKYYKADVLARLFSKPGRMTKEMQADLNGFLKSLPHRVITKPYRIMKEFEEEEILRRGYRK